MMHLEHRTILTELESIFEYKIQAFWLVFSITNYCVWGRKSDDWLQAEVGIRTIHFLCGDTSIITISVPVHCVPCLRWGHVWPQPQASAQCCQLRPISGECSLSQTQSTNHAWRDEGFSHQPSSSCPLQASFLMDYESCVRHSSCFFVLGSIDILIFAQMKGNVDHQTPDFDRDGAWDKGHNGKAYDGHPFFGKWEVETISQQIL